MKIMHQKGFTLIELMVTIAIMGIIASMAAPLFTQIIRQNQLNDDARDFVNTLINVRAEGVLKQREQTITIAKESEDEGEEEPSEENPTDVPLDWSPKAKTKWATGQPAALSVTYNMMGRLKSNQNLCFVLEHVKDTSKKAVIIARITGNVIYDKSLKACPTDLGED